MDDRIKIVYSWIGPRGPIWNTELPNILSFAGVAEGADTVSHKYWADDFWNRLFGPRRQWFDTYPACSIEENDQRPFIVPFSLTWRVGFNNYFCGETGILEFAHIPWHLIYLVRNSNGYLLIDHSVEAFMSDGELEAMHGYFQGIHGIPLNKVIYLTGTINAGEIYESYCERNRISKEPHDRLKVISYASSQQVFSSYLEQGAEEPQYNSDYLPKKLFLMWNRRYRRHRIELALSLEKYNLVDRSYVSFHHVNLENPAQDFKKSLNDDYLIHESGLGITERVIENFKNKLPLVIDGETNINKMCEDFDNAARPYYQNSLISIVTETNWDLPEMTLTEKSFKPAKEKHPFIIVGVKGVMKAMRNLGFKTFSDFWDESYDNIDCPQQRMIAIAEVCRQIGEWSPKKIKEFKKSVKPTVDHNWQQLKKSPSEILVNSMRDYILENRV